MSDPGSLLLRNRAWAAAKRDEVPELFPRLSRGQSPKFLWIGCSDSRVPATTIVDAAPGEIFVHRNIANMIPADDANGQAVLSYALEVLRIPHIIVVGHYGCGGVKAVLENNIPTGTTVWLSRLTEVLDAARTEIEAIEDPVTRWNRACELNVLGQVESLNRMALIRDIRARGQALTVSGWVYDLKDGLLRALTPPLGAG